MKNYSKIMLLCAAVCANTVYGAQSFKETQIQRDHFLASAMYPDNLYTDPNNNDNMYMTSPDDRLKVIEAPHNNGYVRIYGNGYVEFSTRSLQTINGNGKAVISDMSSIQNLGDGLVACGMGIIYPNQMKLILYDVNNAEYGISCLGLFGEKLNNTWNSDDSFKITINSNLPVLPPTTVQFASQKPKAMPNIKAIAEDLTQIIKNTKDSSDINTAITNYLQSNNFLNMISNSNLTTPSIQPTMPQPSTNTAAIPLEQSPSTTTTMQPGNPPTPTTMQNQTQIASMPSMKPIIPQPIDTTMMALQQKSSVMPPMQPANQAATTIVQNQDQMASIPSMQPITPQPNNRIPTPVPINNLANAAITPPVIEAANQQPSINTQINKTSLGNIGQPVIIEQEQVADKQKFNNERKRNNWSSGWFKKQNKSLSLN